MQRFLFTIVLLAVIAAVFAGQTGSNCPPQTAPPRGGPVVLGVKKRPMQQQSAPAPQSKPSQARAPSPQHRPASQNKPARTVPHRGQPANKRRNPISSLRVGKPVVTNRHFAFLGQKKRGSKNNVNQGKEEKQLKAIEALQKLKGLPSAFIGVIKKFLTDFRKKLLLKAQLKGKNVKPFKQYKPFKKLANNIANDPQLRDALPQSQLKQARLEDYSPVYITTTKVGPHRQSQLDDTPIITEIAPGVNVLSCQIDCLSRFILPSGETQLFSSCSTRFYSYGTFDDVCETPQTAGTHYGSLAIQICARYSGCVVSERADILSTPMTGAVFATVRGENSARTGARLASNFDKQG